ncbi:MAG TPA: hypothetical protein VIL82_11385 [Solirubrobacteraceae bacterium]|jgi:hypothetical protein
MAADDKDNLDDVVDRESAPLERESKQLERESKKLGDEIEDVRSDWRAKQRDEGVPGAVGGDSPEREATEHEDDASEQEGAPEHEGVSESDG